MKNLFKQKWFQIFIGWLISQSILNKIFAKRRQKQKEEEEALMNRVDDLFDNANEELFMFHPSNHKPLDLTQFNIDFDKEG